MLDNVVRVEVGTNQPGDHRLLWETKQTELTTCSN